MTYSLDLKNAVLQFHKKNTSTSYRTIASIFGISHTTAYYWIHPLPQAPSSNLIDCEVIRDYIKNKLLENPFVTLRKLKCQIRENLDYNVSISFIQSVIKLLGFSYKRTRFKKYYKDVEETNKRRKEFQETFSAKLYKKCIVIDETYINSSSIPLYGYSFRGVPLYRDMKLPSEKLSIICGIEYSGKRYVKILNKNVTSQVFIEFLEGLPDNSYILMDNVSFHKSKQVKAVLAEKNITAYFVPPYSPDFSAIELAFSKCKRTYRSDNTERQEISSFDKAHHVFTKTVLTDNDIKNMFDHTMSHIFRPTRS